MWRREAAANGDGTARLGTAMILLASVMFGAMAVCVRAATAALPPLQVAFVRFAGSLAVLLLVSRGRNLRPRPGNLGPLLARGLLGAGAIGLYYVAIARAGAGLATLLQCTYPVATAVIAALWMGERLSARIAAAIGLNLLGVVIVAGPGAGQGPDVALGCLAALGSAVFAGGAVATARRLRGSETAVLITTYFMAVGAGVTAPALLSGVPPVPAPLAAALAGVVLTSVAGQWLLHHGLGFTTATRGSVAAATSVVTAAGLEALVFGGGIGIRLVLGAVCTVGAVALVTAGAAQGRQAPGEPVGPVS